MHLPSRICLLRFIPAGAGNTRACTGVSPALAVYPRWRGEHHTTQSERLNTNGLSPLARGTHLNFFVMRQAARFIPAGAGNTLSSLRLPISVPVYPRWRGEHLYQTKTG